MTSSGVNIPEGNNNARAITPVQVAVSDETSKDGNGKTQGQQGNKIVRLKDMTYGHRRELAVKLDPITDGAGDWEALAHQSGILSLEQIIKISCQYFSGGEPSRHFMESFRRSNPYTTIGDFKKVCADLQRNDVVRVLEGENEKTCFGDIQQSVMERIGLLLKTGKTAYESDWELVADRYGYSPQALKMLKIPAARNRKYSPTMALLEAFEAVKPELTLEQLIAFAEQIKRKDVVEVLTNTIDAIILKSSE